MSLDRDEYPGLPIKVKKYKKRVIKIDSLFFKQYAVGSAKKILMGGHISRSFINSFGLFC